MAEDVVTFTGCQDESLGPGTSGAVRIAAGASDADITRSPANDRSFQYRMRSALTRCLTVLGARTRSQRVQMAAFTSRATRSPDSSAPCIQPSIQTEVCSPAK